MKKKIGCIYTGGTIGMVSTKSGYAPQKDYLEHALHQIRDFQNESMPQWDLIEFDPLLDSSNITVYDWNKIASVIYEKYAQYG